MQYKNDTNLQQRINIHDYSTATVGWYPWLFGKINLKPNMKILEVGCGNAAFWENVSDKLPKGLEIHLTDYCIISIRIAEPDFTGRSKSG